MSDEDILDGEDSDTQVLTAEYKDGRLQILDMPSLQDEEGSSQELRPGSRKYMQVLDPEKGLVQLNLTLVRCEGEEGASSYRLVTNAECEEGGDSSPVTCVLQDTEESESDVSYVVVDSEEDMVMVEPGASEPAPSEPTPEVALQTDVVVPNNVHSLNKSKIPKVSPEELIRRAYAVRQLKQQSQWAPVPRRGRKRRGLPPPHELLASPTFRLFLYSCKQCAYKCNAIKDLTLHRTVEHGKVRSTQHSAFQCARCPYRASIPQQLTKHMEEVHCDDSRLTIGKMITLDSKEVEDADVLVCGACGYECAERDAFKLHITQRHM